MKKTSQPWLGDPLLESVLILAPAIVPVIAVILFKGYFTTASVSTLWWVILVLCIDVSHVYSTLFRLYWDKTTFQSYKSVLILIPLVAFVFGALLHFYDSLIFWRLLAYTAVYHFVRQQYGFMRLYSRREHQTRIDRLINSLAIYSATIYPLVHWHMNSKSTIHWFIQGDFITLPWKQYEQIFFGLYLAIILVYVAWEIRKVINNGTVNVPKNFILLGTYLSWYVGIVLFDGDLIFTLLNVVAHGIPYMGLIWIHGKKRAPAGTFNFNFKGSLIFIGVLFVLAYVEEHFWDTLIWKEHASVFPVFGSLSVDSNLAVSIIVALLALPQITHYVLDGFIWRFSKDQSARIEVSQ